MKQINVAIVGVGNCAKSLLEGIAFYTQHKAELGGLMHPQIGPYHPSDVRCVAAFDIDARKVNKYLHEAIAAEPNKTEKIADPLSYDVIIQRGVTKDSVIPEARKYYIFESDLPSVNIAETLKKSRAQMVINYLPTGSDEATYAYAQAALDAGCSFINCMPTGIAKDQQMMKSFAKMGLVLMGDDIKSQLGATVLNRMLLNLLKMRGVQLTASTQVNYGGNADHFNLHYRPEGKVAAKEAALNSILDKGDVRPSVRQSYVEENYDFKEAQIHIDGKIFGNVPVSITVCLQDQDSPNSAGVVIDAIRAAKVLIDEGRPQDAQWICPFLMKAPSVNLSEVEALGKFNAVIGQGPQRGQRICRRSA